MLLNFQVAQLGENALMISVVPLDVGKPTVRLEKTAIEDGCCRWLNSVYETVKFVREPKSGKISERIYNFIVSTVRNIAKLLCSIFLFIFMWLFKRFVFVCCCRDCQRLVLLVKLRLILLTMLRRLKLLLFLSP